MIQDKPLILISNDDGVSSQGLQALIDVASLFGQLFVVAPDGGRSGQSSAITSKVPIRATLLKSEDNLTIYSCTGTPVDCVKLALGNLLPRKPDLILSGINHGSNASVNVHYSGTMAIAIEGALNQIPSIGFSLDTHLSDVSFTEAVFYAEKIIKYVLKKGLPFDTCLNVNIPNISPVKGIKICRQAKAVWSEEFEKRIDPHKHDYYWLTGFLMNAEPSIKDTDLYAISEGYTSVVPCKVDLTCYSTLNDLKELE